MIDHVLQIWLELSAHFEGAVNALGWNLWRLDFWAEETVLARY